MCNGGDFIRSGSILVCVACCALVGSAAIAVADQPNESSVVESRPQGPVRPLVKPLQVAENESVKLNPIHQSTPTVSTWNKIARAIHAEASQNHSSSRSAVVTASPQPAAASPNAVVPLVRQVAGESDYDRVSEPVLVPIERVPTGDGVRLDHDNGRVTLVATGAELTSVLRMIADHHSMNLVLAPDVSGPVTVSIRGAAMEEVLDAILGVAGFSWHRVGNLLYVTGASSPGMDPRVQGRILQVYPLDYIAAADVESVANSLLSPVGSAFVSEADSTDQKKTREVLVVEDTPAAHMRIAQYIAQIDVPPRQVLVEAHLLQIALDGEDRHGVNLRTLARFEGAEITLEGTNMAEEESAGPSVALRVEGTDMTGLLELIRSQNNSRTLASPKLSVVNHQEAKIQIGQRLPYSVSTTTQTSTVQSVEFLEVGIVLTVRPIITDDGNVLMTVLPKVSGGKITENGFPEEDTTEVSTTILLPDGGGVIIGGLIREENVDSNSFVPGFAKIPVVGNLFKRKASECRRNELIVALVTHIMPDVQGPRQHEIQELQQALPPYASLELTQPVMYGVHQ
tara:strand:+ start:60265 stop:61971 length:1707 start_codon:yes stop_codon:yes gene_type:complete